jgi:hypothetical protein
MVQGDRDAPFYRSSVWVNQELALISYRHADGDPVPVLAFQEEPADCQLLWEGVLASTLYSPKPLIDVDTVIARVKKWLATEQFFPGSADAFSTAWARISSKFIPVLQAIRELASVDVDRELLRRRVEQNGIKEGARMLVLQAVGEPLLSWGMITTPDPTSAFSPVSIRREWRAHINRKLSELRKQGAS